MSPKQKILLIEDEPDLVEVFKIKLEALGYEVEVAENGNVGIKMIKEKKPDLVLLDLVMPEVDGYGVLKVIKSDETLVKVKMYVWSNLTQKDEIERAKKLGADGYLIKSDYTPSTLAAEVRRILNYK